MEMKKILLTSLTVAASLALFAGCDSKKESKTDDGKDVTLRISWWGNDDRHKATLTAIEAFEKANPGIKVEAEYAGWDGVVEKMATQIAGGTEPDVMQINYDWYLNYSADGTGFYNLNDLKDEIDLSGYSEETLDMGTIDGKLNGIPHGQNAYVMGINQTMYEKFGVDVDELKSWDDYVAAAKKFDKGYYPLEINDMKEINCYMTQLTGKAMLSDDGKFQWTKAEMQKGFEWYQSLVDAGVTPSKKTLTETIGTNHISTVSQFIDGHYDGFFDWTGGLPSYSAALTESGNKLGIPSFPTLEGSDSNGVILKPTMLFSISKNTKHPKEAAKLLNFLLNEKAGVEAMGVTRGLPVNSNAVEILEKEGLVDETAAAANEYLLNTTGVIESMYFENSTVVEAYNTVFEKYALGQLSAKDAAAEMISSVEAAVDGVKSSLE